MIRLWLAALIAMACAILIAFVLPVPAHAKCKIVKFCQPGQENCEPMCMTTSDGGPDREHMYTDGRDRRRQFYQQRAARAAEQRRDRAPWGSDYDTSSRGVAQRQQEGRDRWRDGQVVQGLPGKISPFVPGSTQDIAWREERKRRGIQ
jgi:hypothetical protein